MIISRLIHVDINGIISFFFFFKQLSCIPKFKGTFHPKISTTKDKNGKDLIQVEEIKKRWKAYTKELYKKDLNDQITTMVW